MAWRGPPPSAQIGAVGPFWREPAGLRDPEAVGAPTLCWDPPMSYSSHPSQAYCPHRRPFLSPEARDAFTLGGERVLTATETQPSGAQT